MEARPNLVLLLHFVGAIPNIQDEKTFIEPSSRISSKKNYSKPLNVTVFLLIFL